MSQLYGTFDYDLFAKCLDCDVEMFKDPKSAQNTSNVTENEFRIVEVTDELTN